MAAKNAVSFGFFLAVSLFLTGCAGIPSHSVRVLPAPVTSFPPTEPALIRLPIVVIFPSGANMVDHVVHLFQNELRPKMSNPTPAPGTPLKFHVEDVWAKIQKPIFLDKGVWLLIHPKTLSLGRVETDPHKIWTIHTALETTANPEVVFGPQPPVADVPMPPLQYFIPGPPTFQATSNTRISYKEINKYLKDPRLHFIGMVVPGTGGQKLTLDAIRFYGSGGKVIVEIKLHYNPLIVNLGTKPAKLTIYLRGTPHYLPKERMFDLPDLDYDLKTSDVMIQVADWLFKSDFRNQLRHVVRLPIGPKMDEMKEKIDVALNRPLGPFIRVKTQVDSFEVLNGLADNEGIEVRLFIHGTAALELTWN